MLQQPQPTFDYSVFIAGFIVFVREKKGLSCKALAKKLGTHYIYHWQIETATKNMSSAKIQSILLELDIDYPTFLSLLSEYILHLQNTYSSN